MRAPGRIAVVVLAAAAALACVTASRAPSRVNVLLVTVDSLRADRIDWHPGGRTPALARLAAGGTRFTNAFTVTPWTAPSLVSIFTGLEPPTHGVAHRDDTTPATLPTLPRLLASRGFSLSNFGFFTAVSYYRNLGLPPQAVTGAEVIGAKALADFLPTAKEPFFAWIHFVEPHLPYGAGGYEAATAAVPGGSALSRAQLSATVPVHGDLAFEPGDREKVLALYDHDVEAFDRSLGSVLAALADRALDDRTLVVLTADHGEELLDHGWVGHASTSGEAKLTDELLRVPLVLRGPGVPRGHVTDALAQNVDVTPTVLDLEGMARPRGMQGISLLRAMEGSGRVRRFVFFDTVPGGHLTPPERWNERLQGVSDGKRVHAERLGASRRAEDPSSPDLAPALAAWRKRQARARLALLSTYGGAARPPADEVERYAENLEIEAPGDGALLEFVAADGVIRLAWRGEPKSGASYWVEYEVGSGLLSARGAFPVEETSIAFGPFPVAFWNDLAGYSPFRFRILDPARKIRSAWHRFSLAATVGKGAR
ncbi:MAG TPA: sulfatase [Thermoanaerobaculia bacterium]|nr:sulfatase [Thermoanaerobaculia bacterium]